MMTVVCMLILQEATDDKSSKFRLINGQFEINRRHDDNIGTDTDAFVDVV